MADKKFEEKSWAEQVQDLYGQISNRPAFAYNPETDPLYQGYKNQYVHQGQRAMEDTLGQAAALTGGYNSSYAQGVGQQAYNEQMTKLSAQIPALAQQARAAYDAEGNRLMDQYKLAMGMENQEYARGRDALADQRYDAEWAQQLQAYQDDQNYRNWQMQQEEQSRAYQMVMQMIGTGQVPSAELLAAAGVSADYARSMAGYYGQQAAMAASGGGGRSGSSSGGRSYGGGSGSGTGETAQAQYNPLIGGVVGAAAGVAGAQTAAQSNITDSDRSKLFEYGRANGPQALADYMERNYKNAPNYWAVRKWLQEELGNYQRARSGGSGGKNLDAIM